MLLQLPAAVNAVNATSAVVKAGVNADNPASAAVQAATVAIRWCECSYHLV